MNILPLHERYITQTIASALVEVLAIPLDLMIKFVSKSLFMNRMLWLDSLYALSK
jgi:hypothetical protein